MNPQSRPFLQLLTEMLKSTHRIHQNRLTIAQTKRIFNLLNSRRKGYIDLADIYQLTQQASEDQLFIIFKYLDRSRTGKIQLQDLITVVGQTSYGTQMNHSETQDRIIKKKFQEFLDIVKDNLLNLEAKKQELRLNKQKVGELYRKIINFYSNDDSDDYNQTLPMENLIKFLTLEWGFSKSLVFELDKLFPNLNITESQFCNVFLPVTNLRLPKQTPKVGKIYDSDKSQTEYNMRLKERENMLKRMEKEHFLKDSHQQELRPNFRPMSAKPSHQKGIPSYAPNYNEQPINRNMNSHEEELREKYQKATSPTYSSLLQKLLIKQNHGKVTHQRHNIEHYQENEEKTRSTNLQDNYLKLESHLTQTEKRREQLRRGSVERKRLMDEVLSRKKIDLSNGKNSYEEDLMSKKYESRGHTPLKHSYSGNIDKSLRETRNVGKFDNNWQKQYIRGLKLQSQLRNQTSPSEFYNSRVPSHLARQNERTREQENRNYGNQKSYGQNGHIKIYDQELNYRCPRADPFRTQYEKYQSEVDRILMSRQSQRLQQPESGYNYENSQPYYRAMKESYLDRKPLAHNNFMNSGWGKQSLRNQNLHSSLQKENILKRAEDEATRKIEQIERKARMKVIEKKSSSGFRWLKA